MACYSPLQGYKDLVTGGLTFKKTPIPLTVACSQCLGCRTDRVAMWAMRLVHEASLHQSGLNNCFLTLTYRDRAECTPEQYRQGHYLPPDGSLRKGDIQKFFKRLRKRYVRYYVDDDGDRQAENPIRYFQCGEYGDQTWRPHHHVCLFNHSFDDLVLWKDDQGVYTWESKTLSELWPYGFCTVSELNYASAAYTAGYVLKKITGKKAQDHYLRCDDYGVAYWLEPEYVTMSRRPGIGSDWYERYKTDVFPADETPIPGESRVSQKVPRYYEEILKKENPELHDAVKVVRQTWIEEHKDDFEPERLKAKYDCHKAKNKRKTRDSI